MNIFAELVRAVQKNPILMVGGLVALFIGAQLLNRMRATEVVGDPADADAAAPADTLPGVGALPNATASPYDSGWMNWGSPSVFPSPYTQPQSPWTYPLEPAPEPIWYPDPLPIAQPADPVPPIIEYVPPRPPTPPPAPIVPPPLPLADPRPVPLPIITPPPVPPPNIYPPAPLPLPPTPILTTPPPHTTRPPKPGIGPGRGRPGAGGSRGISLPPPLRVRTH